MSTAAQTRPTAMSAFERVADWLRLHRHTVAVLMLGLLARVVLVPLTSGGDFNMWSLTAAATLHGRDIYTNPPLPIEKAGPYAYFPLYLYVLLPLKWLALHTGAPYVILGKVPVIAGDVGVALALLGVLRRAGMSEAACAAGTALFFLNPMVLYNGPFYGRFDSLCLAALLLAWRHLEQPVTPGKRLAGWYAIAVTLKTFPIFLLPYLVRRTGLRRSAGAAIAAAALPLLVSLPYLLHDAGRFFYIVFTYDSTKGPRQFSWQLGLLDMGLSEHVVKLVSYVLLGLYGIILLSLLWVRTPGARGVDCQCLEDSSHGLTDASDLTILHGRQIKDRFSVAAERIQTVAGGANVFDPYVYAAIAFSLFLLLSKVAYEQYFLWPMPFLAILAVRDRSRAATLLLVVLSTTGLTDNRWFHPFGYSPGPALWLNGLIAAAIVFFALSALGLRGEKDGAAVATAA